MRPTRSQAAERNSFRVHAPFRVLEARSGYVRVAAGGGACEFWLRGNGVEAIAFGAAHSIDIAWREGAVSARVDCGTSPVPLVLQAAAVHQPLTTLYSGLPLQSYDSGARRFWRNVFMIVRLPGGRWLLGWLARRARRT